MWIIGRFQHEEVGRRRRGGMGLIVGRDAKTF